MENPAESTLQKGHLEYLKEFEAYLFSNGFSKITVKNYISDLKKFFTWKGKDPFFSTDLENYRRFLNSTSVAPATEKRIIATITKFGRYIQSNVLVASHSVDVTQSVVEPVHGMNKSKAYLESKRKVSLPTVPIYAYYVLAVILVVFSIGFLLLNLPENRSNDVESTDSLVLGDEAEQDSAGNSATPKEVTYDKASSSFLSKYFMIKSDSGDDVASFDDKYLKFGVTKLSLDAELDVYEDAFFHKKVNIKNNLVVKGDILGRGSLVLDGGATFLNGVHMNSDLYVQGDVEIAGDTDFNSPVVFTDQVTFQDLQASSTLYIDENNNLTTVAPSGTPVVRWDRSGTTLSPIVAGDSVSTSGNISTTGSGTATFAGLVTASNGLSLTTGELNLTSTSGALSLILSSSQTAFSVNNGLFNIDTLNSRVGIGTTNPLTTFHIVGTDGIVIPVGTTGQRPATPTTGTIRYNSTTEQFEGYSSSTWGSLGGLIDVDQDTYIIAENSAGADNDQLRFFTAGSERMFISANGNVGIGTTNPGSYALNVNGDTYVLGNISLSGTVDGRDVSADGLNLDNLYTTIGLSALTSDEVDQLENIGSNTISSTQWGYLGALDQGLATTNSPTFAGLTIGSIGIGSTGPNATTSGAYLIGTYDEFANSNSSTVQGVLNDLDADITTLESTSHVAVTLAGTPDYLTLSGQQITLNQIDLATDVTGILPVSNGGTGLATLASNSLYKGNGTGALAISNIYDDGTNVGIGTTAPVGNFHVFAYRPESIDQSQLTNNGNGNNITWQSFTNGVKGTLTKVEVEVFGPSSYSGTVYLREGEGASGSIVSTASLTLSSVATGWYVIDFPDVEVIAGRQYTIHFASSTSSLYWRSNNTNPYSGGRSSSAAGSDQVFRTYVTAQKDFLANTSGLGIGTTNPVYELDVVGVARVSGNTFLASSGGNVGIGTTAPSYSLDVSGTGRFTGDLRLTGALYDTSGSAGSSTNILTSTGTGTSWSSLGSLLDTTYFKQSGNSFGELARLGTNDGYGLSLETNNLDRFYIGSNGNVGIGTTAPAGNLQVFAFQPESVDQSQLTNNGSASGVAWQSFTAGTSGDLTYVEVELSTNTTYSGSVYLRSGEGSGGAILSTATLTLSSAPAGWYSIDFPDVAIVEGQQYTINFAASTIQLYWKRNTGDPYAGGRSSVSAVHDGTFRTYVQSQNDVLVNTLGLGVGNTSPSYRLDVSGTGRFTGDLRLAGAFYDASASAGSSTNILTSTGTGTSWSSITSAISSTAFIQNGNSFTADAVLGTNDAYSLSLETNGTSKLYIDTTGNIGIGGTAPSTLPSMYVGANGNIGIGTTGPTAKLHVLSSAGTTAQILDTADGTNFLEFFNGASSHGGLKYDSGTYGALQLGAASGEGMLLSVNNDATRGIFITSQGVVSIRGVEPFNQQLEVVGDEDSIYAVTTTGNTRRLTMGYDPTGNFGSIYGWDATAGIAKNIVLQRYGGNVGIGTTAPGYLLEARKDQNAETAIAVRNATSGTSANAAIRLVRSETGGAILASTNSDYTAISGFEDSLFLDAGSGINNGLILSAADSTGKIRFFAGNRTNERMRIDESGNVGIGTSSVTHKLHVAQSADSEGLNITGYDDQSSAYFRANLSSSGNTVLAASGAYQMVAGSFMVFDSADNIYLDLPDNAGAKEVRVRDSASANVASIDSDGNGYFAGNVGIGTAGPGAKLDISSTTATEARLTSTSTGYSPQLSFYNGATLGGFLQYRGSTVGSDPNMMKLGSYVSGGQVQIVTGVGANAMRIDSSGNVGIGTTGPTSRLDVRGGASSFRYDVNQTSPNIFTILNLDNTASTLHGAGFTFYLAQTGQSTALPSAKIASGKEVEWTTTGSTNDSFLSFETKLNGTLAEKMRIDSSGNVGIGTTAPAALLEISKDDRANGATFRITNSASVTAAWQAGDVIGDIDFYSSDPSQANVRSRIRSVDDASVNKNFPESVALTFSTYASSTLSEQMRITSAGNVGIGTAAPQSLLHVNGSANDLALFKVLGGTSANSELTIGSYDSNNTAGLATLTGASKFGSIIQGGQNGNLILGIRENDATDGLYVLSGGGNFMTDSTYDTPVAVFKSNGNVGIGTTGPTYTLDVQASTSQVQVKSTTGTNDAAFVATNTGGNLILGRDRSTGGGLMTGSSAYAGIINVNTEHSLQFGTNNNTRMTIGSTGNVGIGTTAPIVALDIPDYNTGNSQFRAGSFEIQPYALNNSALVDNVYYSGGYKYRNTGTGTRIQLNDGSGNMIFQNSVSGSAGAAATVTNRLIILNTGNVGIGTDTPASRFHVNNASAVTGTTSTNLNVAGGYFSTSDADTISLLVMNSSSAITMANVGTAGAQGDPGVLTIQSGGGTTTAYNLITAYNSNTRSDAAAVFRVRADGNVYGEAAFNASGADYAEYFSTKDTDLQAGEVVCIDILNSNSVERCKSASDTNIMGIVSTSPAFLGNSSKDKEENPNYKAIAMLGQIPAKVSNENGAVRIGDSLTAASIPGFVMKANPGDSTVGVALENLDSTEETGTIQVMISRKNKSLTVESVEAKVTERIAAMKIEDEVNVLVSNAIASLTPKNTLTLDENGMVVMSSDPTQQVNLFAGSNELLTLQSNFESLKTNLEAKISGVFEKEYSAQSEVVENTIVSYDGQKVVNATSENRDNILGITTSVNSESETAKVTTRGKSVITVTNENGIIFKGDPITVSSSNDGVGVKAITEGMIVGYALGDAEFNEENQSSIEIAIAPSWYMVAGTDLSLANNVVDLSGNTSLSELSVSGDSLLYGNLNVIGDSRFTNIYATGDLTVGLMRLSSESNSINVSGGDLNLQDEYGAGDIVAFGGKVVMTNTGDVKVLGEVTAKKYNVDTTNVAGASAGKVVILAGQKEATVETTALTDSSLIFVTAEGSSRIFTYEKIGALIKIYTDLELEKDTTVNWWIIN